MQTNLQKSCWNANRPTDVRTKQTNQTTKWFYIMQNTSWETEGQITSAYWEWVVRYGIVLHLIVLHLIGSTSNSSTSNSSTSNSSTSNSSTSNSWQWVRVSKVIISRRGEPVTMILYTCSSNAERDRDQLLVIMDWFHCPDKTIPLYVWTQRNYEDLYRIPLFLCQ